MIRPGAYGGPDWPRLGVLFRYFVLPWLMLAIGIFIGLAI